MQDKKTIKIGIGALIFNKEKMLLCKSNGKWGKKWLIPGGKMSFGETIEETIKREIKEETDLDIEVKKIKNIKSVINPKEFYKKNVHFLMVDVIAETSSDKVKLDDEHKDFKWVTPREALEMDLLVYSREPIEQYLKDQKKQDYLEGWKRCKADFENYKARSEKLRQEDRERTLNNLLLQILPVLDNFNLAIEHIPQQDQDKNWIKGVFYIKKQLEDILEDLGIEEIKCLGKEFDPNFHECIEEVETKDKQKQGKIVQVTQKGYKKGEKVIRAAKVKLGK
ncbi:MAG: nucleotide exchange factor GrpE [Candidatus Moranbacteria bacterium]|nr:nucleotide exchange factor GrpE [Candidatus Moranbacteria bacterium]